MRVIALTGSIASGKSSVSALFRAWGATVIDADAIVHALQRHGEPVFNAMVSAFGSSILGKDGELDRAALRMRISTDAAARAQLESIVHPAVLHERNRRIDEARARDDRIVVADIPLLFESGDPEFFDGVVVVSAPDDLRLQRLIRDRHFTEHDARALMSTQLPLAEKRRRATWVIENDGSAAELEQRAREVWDALIR